MKENARKLLAKVGITRSFPNGKRSVNAGIHAIFLDSAVFTVSENAGKRPQKAGFHSLTAVNSRFSVRKLRVNAGIQDVHRVLTDQWSRWLPGGRYLQGNRWFSPPASMTSCLASVTFKMARKVFIEEKDKNFQFVKEILLQFLRFGDNFYKYLPHLWIAIFGHFDWLP